MHVFSVQGGLHRYEAFPSDRVAARNVDVWLPPGYDERPDHRYPVIYLHDGQNLFDPALSFSGTDWGVDEALNRLIESGEVPAAIAVGIWNSPQRIPEYMPQKPMERMGSAKMSERFEEKYGGDPCSDDYLAFIVEELKPFLDRTYRTEVGPEHTLIMGSSMGGLVSLYALCEYPEVFGGAACLSTSWTVGGRVMMPYLRQALPAAASHRLYFDYGVEAQIATYETYQRQADRLILSAGYQRDQTLMTRRFPGAAHSEQAWRERVDVPLQFLLGRPGLAYRSAARLCA